MMNKALERLGRLIFLAILLAYILAPSTAAAVESGLPEVLLFDVQDLRILGAGVSLTFDVELTNRFLYRCQHIVFREEHREREIKFVLLGVEAANDDSYCWKVKDKQRFLDRIALPIAPGNYRIVFIEGQRQDTYAMAVSADGVEVAAVNSPTFTRPR